MGAELFGKPPSSGFPVIDQGIEGPNMALISFPPALVLLVDHSGRGYIQSTANGHLSG